MRSGNARTPKRRSPHDLFTGRPLGVSGYILVLELTCCRFAAKAAAGISIEPRNENPLIRCNRPPTDRTPDWQRTGGA